MNNKGKLRFVSILTALLLIIVPLAGCSSDTNSNAPSNNSSSQAQIGGTLPIVATPITITWFHSPPVTQTVNSLNDLEAVQELEKRTGINIEFIHPSRSDKGEMLSTLLASGEYPDLIRDNFNSYKGGIEQAIKDKIIFDYTDLVAQYAVNYNNLVKSMDAEKLVISDNGMQVAFGSTFAPKEFLETPFSGLVIRQDWLDELNLKVPETMDDWYNVLKVFKKEKNCDGPLSLSAATFTSPRAQSFVSSYGAAYCFLLKNDEVKYGPILPEFKEFLETFSKWYSEGLINKDIATVDHYNNILPMLAQGQAGAAEVHPISIANVYKMVDYSKIPEYKLAPCPFPQVVKGEACQYRHGYAAYNAKPTLVTTKNKYQVESIKLIDYLYSQEGLDLSCWGVTEGRTYTVDANGKRSFTELITKNPEGLSADQAKYKYTLGDIIGQYNWDLEEKQYSLSEQKNATWGIWKTSATTKNYIPDLITMTQEEANEYSNVMQQVDPYTQGMILKFIMGLEPLSKFDEFVSNVKSMGIEKAEASKNAAYTRFKNR